MPAGNPNWVKGQSGNPNGRMPKTAEEKYQKAVYSAIKPAQVKKIVAKIAEKAERGDVAAAKLLFGYLFGLPVATTKLQGENGDLLKVIFEHSQNTNTDVSHGSTGDS